MRPLPSLTLASLTFASLILVARASAAAPSARDLPPPPTFPRGEVVDVIHGQRVADPYRALETGGDPAVKAWSDAENARTRAFLDALPGREAVAARLKHLVSAASPSFGGLSAAGGRVFAMYRDPARQQPMIVRMNAAADPSSRVMVLDPNALDPSGHTEIDWWRASPDGRRIAVSLSQNGSEVGTLHVYDADTGQEVEAPIARVQFPTGGGSLAWSADNSGFWYTRYPGADAPAAEQQLNVQVYFHHIGADPAADPLVLGKADGLPPTAEVFLQGGGDLAPVVTASVQLGDGGEWRQYVIARGAKALRLADYADRITGVAPAPDGSIFAVSRKDAPMGKVLRLRAPYAGGFASAELFAPAERDAAVIDFGESGRPLVADGDRLFVNRIAGGPSQLSVYDTTGHGRTVAIPAIGAVGEIDPAPGGDAFYSVATYLKPSAILRWSHASGASAPTALDATSPVDFSDARVTRAFATSKDGTRVPINIIARKGTRLDGSNPTLLYGYGGFGISETPGFAGAMVRLWLDAGGVYAVANLRGGGEYGQAWHDAGRGAHKQNVFDDFDAAGEWLIKAGYTRHSRLALMGGSNGGLLMGAEITQHPALARAVVSSVGIYDMIRNELDPNGAFNTAEYGSTNDPQLFPAIYAYSPYHHVVAGTAYPAVLMSTGATDGRVNPMNSRKFAAALQAATSSNRPILLRTSANSGHGIGSSLDERIAQQTDTLMFLFAELGMRP